MNYAIILASGVGKRTGIDFPKQFYKINGKTILEYTIEAFEKNKSTDKIILVVHPSYLEFCKNFKYKKIFKVVSGGKTRQESSYIGVSLVEEDSAKVLIHDGARPFLKDELIERCYSALENHMAINTVIDSTDTVIQIDDKGFVVSVPERKFIKRCQTPQGFRAKLIKEAHKKALSNNIKVTDDTGLVVLLNLSPVFVVEGDLQNIKITHKEDLNLANKFFMSE